MIVFGKTGIVGGSIKGLGARTAKRFARLAHRVSSLPVGTLLFLLVLLSEPAHSANPTQLENAKTGTTDWQLTNAAHQREIEGYASLTSVNRGGQIKFFVNTAAPTYTLEIFRLGWYGGTGGRRMTSPVVLNGVQQSVPSPAPVTGLVECDWTDPYIFDIPTVDPDDWVSGVYVAKLTESSGGKQRYIVFSVRDDSRNSKYIFIQAVNTYEAYTNFGGKSLYDFNSTGGPARKVSFNRPYQGGFGDDGAGDFIQGWEYNMVRFIEKEGYDTTYATDVDVHSTPGLLLAHSAVVIVGHNEYWSDEMRLAEEGARTQGVGLGFFGGNIMYWQARFEPSVANSQPNRTLVSYKNAALTSDPFYLDANPANDHLVTTLWRGPPVNQPEDALLGVGWIAESVHSDIVVSNAAHWAFATTGLSNGDHLPGLLGYEVDGVLTHTPAGLNVLAHSPFIVGAQTMNSDMTEYTGVGGGIVFATGSIQFAWGLDSNDPLGTHPGVVHPGAQQLTRNVLARLIGNLPPVADSGGPYTGNALAPVTFNASLSTDPDGTIAEFAWDFGDGNTGIGSSPQHTYAVNGTYNIGLLVRDDKGSTNAATTIATIGPPDIRSSVSSSTLDFAPQLVGTLGGPGIIVFTAIGSGPVSFAGITIDGDYSLETDCPSVLASGHSCTITVTFAPLSSGPLTGTLSITTNSNQSPQDVALSGTGKNSVAQTFDFIGHWSTVEVWPALAVSAHLLPTGKVLFSSETGVSQMWDPSDDSFHPVSQSGFNLNCSGHTFLRDGRLLVAGGEVDPSTGLANSSIFNPFTGTWTAQPDMGKARRCPTAVTAANGDVAVIGGGINSFTGFNQTPEVWQSDTGTWRTLSNAAILHPLDNRSFLALDGSVFITGAGNVSQKLTLDGTGTIASLGSTLVPHDDGTSALYGTGLILSTGGSDPPISATEFIDLTLGSPAWQVVGSMQFRRKQSNLVLLPDGTVLALGGSYGTGFDDSNSPVVAPEIWNAVDGSWTTMEEALIHRGFQSVGVLLPDGRVLSTGGTNSGTQANAQLFSPPYLFRGARPSITGLPTSMAYNVAFNVNTPDAANINRVTLIRLPSVSHGFDSNQRFLELNFVAGAGSVTVTSPANANVAPPGHYMLFLLNNNDVPSEARIIRIDSNAATSPAAPSGLQAAATSYQTIDLSWTDNSENEDFFTLERSADGSNYLPLAIVGVDTTTYTDSGLLGAMTYYYRLRSVNSAGFSTLAGPASATTPSPVLGLSVGNNYDFGDQAVGSLSSPLAVTVTDTGPGPLTITQISTTGNFTQTNDCPATVVENGTCTIVLKFNPQAAGPRTGSLVITSNATVSPREVALNGNGTVAHSVVSVNSLTFAPQLVGTIGGPKIIVINSTGTGPIGFNGLPITGDFALDTNCPGFLPVNQSCTITVTFVPQAAGVRNGTITIQTTATESPQVVNLTGTGKAAVTQTPSFIGQWSPVSAWPALAVSAHLLPTGKLLFSNEAGASQVWDPANNSFQAVASAGFNLNCSGHAFLRYGTLFIAGGEVDANTGVAKASIYNPYTGSWTPQPDMTAARRCPTAVTTSAGDVAVLGGFINSGSGFNLVPEVWQSGSGTWRTLSNVSASLPLDSRSFFTPDGSVFITGPGTAAKKVTITGNGSIATVASTIVAHDDGTSAMYAPGFILTAGGSSPAISTTEIIDLGQGSPAWQVVGSTEFRRKHGNIVLLPDGSVLTLGGSFGNGFDDFNSPVSAAEIWDPADGSWTKMEEAAVYRGFQSVGVLLPDGRVLSAGGTNSGTQSNAQLFSPPYLFHGARPTISALPGSVAYNVAFNVTTPDAANISRVTLIRLPSVSHGFDSNQKFVQLNFTPGSGTVNVTSPADTNVAPPGHYLLFILNNNGVPSVGRIIRIDSDASVAPAAPSALHTTSVTYQNIDLAWTDNSANEDGFTLERSNDGTNFSPLVILSVDATSYSDTAVQGGTTYYYRLRSFNAAGASILVGPVNATTIAPVLNLSVGTNYDFGNQPVGFSSVALDITVTNAGPGSQVFTQFATTGDFSQTNNCPGTLAQNAVCHLLLTFSPLSAGTRNGTLSITSNASPSPRTVTLTGRGTVPQIQISRPSIAFGLQIVNRSSPAQTVDITNTGEAPLMFSDINVPLGYTLVNSCPAALAANATCVLAVSFRPAQVGDYFGNLSIGSNAAQSPQLVPLSGTGWDLQISLSRPTRPSRNGGGPSAFFEVDVWGATASLPAQVTCKAVPATLGCSVDRQAIVLGATPTRIRVSATQQTARRLKGNRSVSGTVSVIVTAGSLTRTIEVEVTVQ